eukprot:1031494-Rhodomonas_salina.2
MLENAGIVNQTVAGLRAWLGHSTAVMDVLACNWTTTSAVDVRGKFNTLICIVVPPYTNSEVGANEEIRTAPAS